MQNDFIHPDGWFASNGVDRAPIRSVIPAIIIGPPDAQADFP